MSTSLFKTKLEDLFKETEDDEVSLILKVMSFLFYQNNKNTSMADIYKTMSKSYGVSQGLDITYKLIDLFNGHDVNFMTIRDFHDNLIIAICYYYKEVVGWDWSTIKKKVPFELNAVSIANKIKSLNKWIKKNINYIYKISKQRNEDE
jgi:hypothetical protein